MPTLAPSRPGGSTPATSGTATSGASGTATSGASGTVELVLGDVRHGLLDAPGECRDLDAVLAAARAADTDGAACVVVGSSAPDTPGRHHRSGAAQALAVLLATERVTVALTVHAPAWDAATLARFATSTDALGGGRLVLRVAGPGATELAEAVARRGATTVTVPEEPDTGARGV